MKKSKLILLVALLVASFMSLSGCVFNIYNLTTNYMMEMHDAVYLDASETLFNGDKKTLVKGESITSVTVTLVNTSNKSFDDKKVRLMYYNDYHSSVSAGNTEFTYPEGYSLYNTIVDIGAKETITVTFTEFRNVWYYNDTFRVAFEYKWQDGIDLNSSAAWWQLDDGGEFKSHYNSFFLVGAISAFVTFTACTTIAIILIIKEKKE